MLSGERDIEVDSYLISHGPWKVRELPLDAVKAAWLWEKVQTFKTIYSDLIPDKATAFAAMLQNPFSFWLEIVGEEGPVGLFYVDGLDQVVDANIHLLFYDRKLGDKSELIKEMIELVFRRFPGLHRLTAALPDIYFGTKRLALRSGLKPEGVKRQALLIGGRWVDEALYGVLAHEVLNGTN